MLGSASSLTGCSWIPVFYMERLPIWPPQPSYWATRYLLVRLDVRLSGFWLSVTTVKDLRMTAGTNGFTCFPRHGGVTPPPTSKLRATTEKFLMEKPNNTFCPTWESNPGPRTHQSRLRPRAINKLKHLNPCIKMCNAHRRAIATALMLHWYIWEQK